MSDATTPYPPTLDNVTTQARLSGAIVYGCNHAGETDVELPSVGAAYEFAVNALTLFGWEVDIRAGDTITSLAQRVVVTVKPDR